MKSTINIVDHKVTSALNVEDGTYVINLEKKCDNKTLEQTRKLWATCTDISMEIYGNKEDKDIVYLQVLKMAGQRTYRITIEEDLIDELKKQKGVKCVSILSRDVVNHKAMAMCDVCMTGISEMDKQEVSKVIDAACRWCDELGIVPQIERTIYEG